MTTHERGKAVLGATEEKRFPYDRGTSSILDLIRDKQKVPADGITKLIRRECGYWSDHCKGYSINGAAFTIGRRLTRMRKAWLIFIVADNDGTEYYTSSRP